MFEKLSLAPEDPILGLAAAFNRDPSPAKINIAQGIYLDETGRTPTLAAVRRAEEILLQTAPPKTYLPIEGSAKYNEGVAELVLGATLRAQLGARVAVLQTPGGTGAVRLGAEIVRLMNGHVTAWISNPSWPNHPNVCRAAGLKAAEYPYFDFAKKRRDIDATLATLARATHGDVVVLHGCCHNPTGDDPSESEWRAILTAMQQHGLVPLFDSAYQGLARGIEQDAHPIRLAAEMGLEFLAAVSFSKNLGLYGERVGALLIVGNDADPVKRALSQAKTVVRTAWSSPSAHGARVAETVMTNAELRPLWLNELEAMRTRLVQMRQDMVRLMTERGFGEQFAPFAEQHGMFALTDLSGERARWLRNEHKLYLIESGRINVAGLNKGNQVAVADLFARALAREQTPVAAK